MKVVVVQTCNASLYQGKLCVYKMYFIRQKNSVLIQQKC